MAYGLAKGSSSNKMSSGGSTTIVVVVCMVVVVGYFLVKRRLGIKSAPRNQDILSMLAAPFQRFPNDVRIGVVRKAGSGSAAPLSGDQVRTFVERVVWPAVSADLFVCRSCRRRRDEFIATMGGDGGLEQIVCPSCASQECRHS
jgi:hypothetical protein